MLLPGMYAAHHGDSTQLLVSVCAHGDKQASPGCIVVKEQQDMLLPGMYAAHHGDSENQLRSVYNVYPGEPCQFLMTMEK